jgi:hypothetical protein
MPDSNDVARRRARTLARRWIERMLTEGKPARVQLRRPAPKTVMLNGKKRV